MATDYGAYAGKVLSIDLTSQTVREYPWSDRQRKLYLGGKAMAFRILYDILDGHEEPLSEENPVILSTGPLTGTGAPSCTRFDITALSPMTGLPASSNCGGRFGLYLKKAGYDALILTGRCRGRCWIEIRDDKVLFHDAASLWGLSGAACQTEISHFLDTSDIGQICIGPAGEHLVRYAAVTGDGRAAGRTGIGAVLGWKNLKAIAVTGTKAIPLFDTEKTAKFNKAWFTSLHTHPLTGGKRADDSEKGRCIGCPIHCGKQGKDDKTSALEALCGADSSFCWEELLNNWGMDTIAAADAAAWAVEASAAGLFPHTVTINGCDDLFRLLEEIALGRGIGKELGMGERWLSEQYGFSLSGCKGHNGHRRRTGFGKVLSALGVEEPDESLQFAAALLHFDLTEAISAAGQCMFAVNGCCDPRLFTAPNCIAARTKRFITTHCSGVFSLLVKYPSLLPSSTFPQITMLRHAAGMKLTAADFLLAGRRSHQLEQELACRFAEHRFKLPKGLPKSCRAVYYALRHWDENGLPTTKSRKLLSIDEKTSVR